MIANLVLSVVCLRTLRALTCAIFALIGLLLSPLAGYASPPFDYQQERRDHPAPAGKATQDLQQGEPRTVRMIYFLPNDRPYHAETVDFIKWNMHQVQALFAEQMRAHGQGNTAIRFEADAEGEPLVLRVDGKHPAQYYSIESTFEKVQVEIGSVFDISENIYIITIEIDKVKFRGSEHLGVGGQIGKNGGLALVSKTGIIAIAHELGHAFGLHHDFRDDKYVMSYGWLPEELSACNAASLAVHPYFNANIPIEVGSRPTVEKITQDPFYIAGATSIPVRIKVGSSDGLHQAILLSETPAPHPAAGFFEVKGCRGLRGKRNSVVEFDYDGTVPSHEASDFNSFETQELLIQVVNALGDFSSDVFFEIVNNEFKKPISTFLFNGEDERELSSKIFWSMSRALALESADPWLKDRTVKLWDVYTGKVIATLPELGPILCWALSPDGRLLALEGPNRTIVLWDILSRKQHVATTPVYPQDPDFELVVSSLAFSPDGRLLASGGAGAYYDAVKLWDVAKGSHFATFFKEDLRGTVIDLAFSPDGKLLAEYNAGGIVNLWDVASGKHVAEIEAHENSDSHGHVMSFSPDGKLLATAGKKWTIEGVKEEMEVKLWDVASGERVAIISGSSPVAFSPAGRLLALASPMKVMWGLNEVGARQGASSGGEQLKLWDVATSKPVALFPSLYPSGVAFSPDGKLLSESGGGMVRVWDVSEWIGEQTLTTVEQAMPHTLTKVSGDSQEGPASTQLAAPFVVLVLDEDGVAIAGVDVLFTVTAGGGKLSSSTATTNANGRATAYLTLGSEPGTNTVEATVAGLASVTFTATGQESPLASLFDLFRGGKRVALPDSPQLAQNAPNPFNNQTVLSYFLSEPGSMRLEVFALNGQRVAVLSQGPQQAGYHRLHWDGRDDAGRLVASGAYLYRLAIDETVLTRKLILLR